MPSSAEAEVVRYAVQAIENELASPSRRSREAALATLESFQGTLSDATAVAESVERMFKSTIEVVRLGMVLEAELERLRIETGYKRDRLNALAPAATKALEGIGQRIQILINQAIAIDPRNCPESQIQWRNQLLELAERHTESLNSALLRLLA